MSALTLINARLGAEAQALQTLYVDCLLYTSPSPRD